MRGAIVLLVGLALAAPATAAPPLVTHVYPSGRLAATVTATGPSREIAQAQVAILATTRRLTLSAHGRFAIHGYPCPSVPAYPAPHGCVRIPMWIAPSLHASHAHGTTVVVHL